MLLDEQRRLSNPSSQISRLGVHTLGNPASISFIAAGIYSIPKDSTMLASISVGNPVIPWDSHRPHPCTGDEDRLFSEYCTTVVKQKHVSSVVENPDNAYLTSVSSSTTRNHL